MVIERFINILIIDDDVKLANELKQILTGSGNNILLVKDHLEAIPIIQKRVVGIILINLDSESFSGMQILQELKNANLEHTNYKILITQDTTSAEQLVHGLKNGAVDIINTPFRPNLVKAKIEVYKTLFQKDQRIGQLLQNIFPTNVLQDLNAHGKFSPKRVEEGVVLFTDFVDFSASSKDLQPIQLLRQLERHFTRFDEIVNKYQLEKIKTIGDAYMALAGVTESKPHPAIRACLAAIEMRHYVENEVQLAKAMGRSSWDIRIGIHQGPLVAGIIGKTKFSFDVWGDTVNVAARAERASVSGKITISEKVMKSVEPYFSFEDRGLIEIHKRGGKVQMYFLSAIKPEFVLGRTAYVSDSKLREICGLPTMDFDNMRNEMLSTLKSLLSETLVYHDVQHTLNVEKAAMRYAKLEGLSEEEIVLLRTAVLYHDSGFIVQYENNEDWAIELAQNHLVNFGYSPAQIAVVCSIIAATKRDAVPKTILEKIMRDADHDYLGRADYKLISNRLREELSVMKNQVFTDSEWIEFQLNYLKNTHRYLTETAKNIRNSGKKARIVELTSQLESIRLKS